MRYYTLEEIQKKLRRECVPSPITIKKLIRVFDYDHELLHQAMNMFAKGEFNHYHMLPETESY